MSLPILHAAKFKAQTDVNGDATITIKVPGTNGKETRMIESGHGWFENKHADDAVTSITIEDTDGILSPPGTVLGRYTESDMTAADEGYYIPYHSGTVLIEAIMNPGWLRGGLYLKIKVKKGDNSIDTFRCNIRWAKP